MPQIDSNVVSLLAGVFAALVQLVKGLVFDNEEMRRRNGGCRWGSHCSVPW